MRRAGYVTTNRLLRFNPAFLNYSILRINSETVYNLSAIARRYIKNKMTCDICGFISDTKVYAGRWIFYCKKHKQNDRDMIYENEILPDLISGDMSYILNDGELAEILL